MARSKGFRLFDLKNYMDLCQKYANARCSINLVPARYLRGSRKNKNGDEDILRFRHISRMLKCDSDSVKSETPVSSENERNYQEDAIESSVSPVHGSEFPNLVTAEDLIKKLEDNFMPLYEKPYEKQLKKKYRKSLSVLKQLGFKLQHLKVPIAMGQDKLPCPVDITLPSPDREAYRNKDDFNIGLGLDGSEKTVGYFLDSPTEFSTTFCMSPKTLPIIRENHVKFAEDFQTFIRMSSLSASQHFADKGYWKNLIVRSNSAGDIMGIVIMHPQDLNQEQLQLEKEKLKDYFSGISKSYNLQSLYFQSCTQSRCTHEQSPFELILGDPCIIEDVNNLKIHISPDSFFHVNTKSVEAMYNLLLKICRVNKSTTVFDIYCGTGPLSLTFSSRVKECIGIDDSTQAISDAKVNATENGMNNVDFIYGHPEYVLRDILNEGFYEDNLTVLNSSRGGISKSMITTLREFKKIKKIIYITSKPHAAMDNFVHLCKPLGYEKLSGKPFLPILAVPVDLYPQTDHYGLIVMFQRL